MAPLDDGAADSPNPNAEEVTPTTATRNNNRESVEDTDNEISKSKEVGTTYNKTPEKLEQAWDYYFPLSIILFTYPAWLI